MVDKYKNHPLASGEAMIRDLEKILKEKKLVDEKTDVVARLKNQTTEELVALLLCVKTELKSRNYVFDMV